MEVEDTKLQKLKEFTEAIFCVHLSTDSVGGNIISLIEEFKDKFSEITRIAVAGGGSYQTIAEIKEANVDIVTIGGAITKAPNIADAARKFREMI
ncbi:hypothetical protein [Fonticella tunisiensis]|uniref:hypothetical protein n=1 Tax=Fonticella tunisiensis TaxID=1096341 RepID=UPI0014150B12|nr:hypothetical protein [Fonticella tunisiensis]